VDFGNGASEPSHAVAQDTTAAKGAGAFDQTNPASVAKLPGEPGAPDFVWADLGSCVLSMAHHSYEVFVLQ
jgi:hypothetical protein